jgi:hypothetical protein
MRINKNEMCKIHLHKDREYFATIKDSFNSISEIRTTVKSKYKGYGIIECAIYQDGFYKSFKINTNI